MNDMQKLRILLAHWVEHNREHAEALRQWAQRAEEHGSREVASRLQSAAQEMNSLNEGLRVTRDLLGDSTP